MTATVPSTAATILAAERGRRKSFVCVYDPATIAASFRSLDTDRVDLSVSGS